MSIWELEGISGTEEFTGTDDVTITQANTRNVGDDTLNQYFMGQISNLSNIDCRIQLYFGTQGQMHTHDLRAKESFNINGLPLTRMAVVVNGTVKVHGMGVILEAETPQDHIMLLSESYMQENLAYYRTYSFSNCTHTDITTATTTTIATPTANTCLRPFKVVMRSAGANIITVQSTDSDGTSNANIIGSYEFTAGGTAEINWGANGWTIPNGNDGLLRAVTTQAVVVDIDVTYDEQDEQ